MKKVIYLLIGFSILVIILSIISYTFFDFVLSLGVLTLKNDMRNKILLIGYFSLFLLILLFLIKYKLLKNKIVRRWNYEKTTLIASVYFRIIKLQF